MIVKMADDSRPSTVDSLRTSPLTVCSNSLVINQLHQTVLQEKRRDFHDLIKKQKKQYENEAKEYLELHNLRKTTDDVGYRKLRSEQQERLNILQGDCQERLNQLFHRFQRDWMIDPVEHDDDVMAYDGSDNGAYIARAVGRALELGIVEVCQNQPDDPIEYLAMWLKSYSLKCQREREKAVEKLKIKLAKEEENIKMDVKKHMKIEVTNLKTDERRRKKEYIQRSKQGQEKKSNTVVKEQSGLVDNSTKSNGFHESINNTNEESKERLCSDGFRHDINHTGNDNSRDNVYQSDDESSRASVLYTIQEKEMDESREQQL